MGSEKQCTSESSGIEVMPSLKSVSEKSCGSPVLSVGKVAVMTDDQSVFSQTVCHSSQS